MTILIYPWQMRLVVLSKLRTALHLKGLCFLELNSRKCHGNPNESKVETVPWLILSCQSCGDECPAPGFQQCPLFHYLFIQYIVLNSCYVQDTVRSRQNKNKLYGPPMDVSRGQVINDCVPYYGTSSSRAFYMTKIRVWDLGQSSEKKCHRAQFKNKCPHTGRKKGIYRGMD